MYLMRHSLKSSTTAEGCLANPTTGLQNPSDLKHYEDGITWALLLLWYHVIYVSSAFNRCTRFKPQPLGASCLSCFEKPLC